VEVVPEPAEGDAADAVRARGRRRRLGSLAARLRGRVAGRPGEGAVMEAGQIVLAPVVSEKSYAGTADRIYTFKVHKDAHKTQVRQAVEALFEVKVARVNIVHVKPKPKRRGLIKGSRQGWKKAIVQLHPGHTIEFFEGAQI